MTETHRRGTNQVSRTPLDKDTIGNPGPYLAEVIGHLDQTYMGSLRVRLIKVSMFGDSTIGPPDDNAENETAIVKYASPFYGATTITSTTGQDAYPHTQQSYGFWAVPPDIGSKVLVIFVEGRRDMGYWIGCIQEPYMNFMVPDGRASTEVTSPATPENLKGKKLPTGEYNKALETTPLGDPTQYTKPYNKDFTEVLEVQGLLDDEIRGTTTSSARREVPSAVFGMNTPGPLDKRLEHPTQGVGVSGKKAEVPRSRLGGSSIVMDDGDDKFIRATHAADGPPLYINKEAGEEGGDETIPQNELIRIRTRTGHQILLHNSEDLIYIANSRGTAWIELTSDGKIDIHADDSISIMTDQDINISATRDINMEAGRNVNIKASARWSDYQPEFNFKESGRVQIESQFVMNLLSGTTMNQRAQTAITVTSNGEIRTDAKGDINVNTEANYRKAAKHSVHEQAGQNWYRKAFSDMTDIIAGSYFTQADGEIHVKSEASILTEAVETVHQLGKTVLNQAADKFSVLSNTFDVDGSTTVNLNSGTSSPPTPATRPIRGNSPDLPQFGRVPQPLKTYPLPYIFPGSSTPIPYDSILCRAPQHEPWPHHENMDPVAFKPEQTDREDPGELSGIDRVLTPDTFLKNGAGRKSSIIIPGTGGIALGRNGGSDETYPNSGVGSTTRTQDPGNYQPYTGPIPTEILPFDIRLEGPPPGYPTVFPAGYENRGTPPNDWGQQGPLATVTAKRAGLSTQVALVWAPNFQGFLDEFEATGYRIHTLYGYYWRRVTGGTSFSAHASGGAIDINPPENGYFRRSAVGGRTVTDMPPNTNQIARKWGLTWGGAWNSVTDAMHFGISDSGKLYRYAESNGWVPHPPRPTVPPKTNVS